MKKSNNKNVDNKLSKSIYQELYNEKTAKDFIFKKIRVGKSFHGFGLFAEENIKKGEKILEYIGNILLGEDADSIVNKYLFQVSKNKTIDGSVR
ncbi:MAG: SET domain-containing protein-lysine N-methyltransferase [Cyanobium sp. MAG06]|nr:SET domain-containing protein-lysine N-methyltransferase [Cyanobium sp. MAG06]